MIKNEVNEVPGELADLLSAPGAVLIDDWNIANHTGTTYLFTNPRSILLAQTHAEVQKALQLISEYQSQGLYCAGYISYDAGLSLDKPMCPRHQPNVPLLWMGVYDSVKRLDRKDAKFDSWDRSSCLSIPRLNIAKQEYLESVKRIKEFISAGDVYQVNYTCKLLFENHGSALGLFARLREAHPVCHSAFINTGDIQIISVSPELFLRKTGSKIITRPMKGTAKRGLCFEADKLAADYLSKDVKNRAENLMIVDLMRNDIGRICEYGSITVPKLFHIERYRTVLQMTSDVVGTLKADKMLNDIICATFPPGSVTGAPKSRALEIIDELERDARGVYCGSIGMFCPNGDFLLNVSIRTVVQRGNKCELGVGSGIVADSDPDLELKETLLKSEFLYLEPHSFDLLETILYDGELRYLDAHISRMRDSAAYFGYRFDETAARKALSEEARTFIPQALYRIRLLMNQHGEFTIESGLLGDFPEPPIRLLLSDRPIDPTKAFLYHKTTHRAEYDTDLKSARQASFFDVVYLNTRGELTECAITNICIKLDGNWYTPPLHCGLLPGIWRWARLSSGELTEQVLTLSDLRRAEAVVIGNSVRGKIVVDSVEKLDGEHIYKKEAV